MKINKTSNIKNDFAQHIAKELARLESSDNPKEISPVHTLSQHNLEKNKLLEAWKDLLFRSELNDLVDQADTYYNRVKIEK